MAVKKTETKEKTAKTTKTTTKAKSTAKKPTAKKATAVKPVVAVEKKHVLYVASEAFPFAGTGGLGEVIGSLPRSINTSSDVEARIIIPLYQSLSAEDRAKLTFITNITVPVAWRNQYCGLFKYEHLGVTYYFIDNEYYFKRSGLYGYGDDGERFAFFSRAVLELMPYFDWRVDVLHAHDWQSALVPVYYKLYYMYKQGYENIKTVFTIHNIEYQGQFSPAILEDVFGISYKEYMSIEFNGCINLMKGAIDYSDYVSTVSPTYAEQIKTAEYAHGLEGILLKNAGKLRGILNGVDVDTYNPETNKALFVNYNKDSIGKKDEGKVELQKMLGLPVNKDVPIIAMITRLASHKGIDIVRRAMNDILKNDVQFIVLGTGEIDHEEYFKYIQNIYDNKVRSIISFNKDLAHKIYAGADIFLMPSKSEPCGLSQMMACRYGTIPVVRKTGGLKDSIIDCENGDTGIGFVFDNYNSDEMLCAIERAVNLYRDHKTKWNGLVTRAISTDFSWNKSAGVYLDFYREILA
ncbi:MAG: glycogen synthase GlgA [Clostridia bacterium]|nr:glycogen synthase GlgA [Clostridia bacterium]